MALSCLTRNSCYYMQAWGCIINTTVSGLWSSWLNLKLGCLFLDYLGYIIIITVFAK